MFELDFTIFTARVLSQLEAVFNAPLRLQMNVAVINRFICPMVKWFLPLFDFELRKRNAFVQVSKLPSDHITTTTTAAKKYGNLQPP